MRRILATIIKRWLCDPNEIISSVLLRLQFQSLTHKKKSLLYSNHATAAVRNWLENLWIKVAKPRPS